MSVRSLPFHADLLTLSAASALHVDAAVRERASNFSFRATIFSPSASNSISAHHIPEI